MCSQPMVQAAQEFRATRRASFSVSPDRASASANRPCWKFRVGRACRRLKVSRLATAPSSRDLAVAGPNDRRDRSRAAATPPAAPGVPVGVADGGVAHPVLAGRADDRAVIVRAKTPVELLRRGVRGLAPQ